MRRKAPVILSIETSTEVCSVALSVGNTLIGQKVSHLPRSHSAIISIITQELLKESKTSLEMCDAIAVSEGPGSYTGLRVGVSFAKGLCYGASKPLISVGSLALLATLASTAIISNKVEGAQIIEKDKIGAITIVPMIDARRMEVYTACYSLTGKKESPVKALTNVEALIIDSNSFYSQLKKGPLLFCGDGSAKVAKVIKDSNALFVNIKALAQGMVPIAVEKFQKKEFEDVAYFEPFYLKDFIVGVSKKNILQTPSKR